MGFDCPECGRNMAKDKEKNKLKQGTELTQKIDGKKRGSFYYKPVKRPRKVVTYKCTNTAQHDDGKDWIVNRDE